MHLREFITVEDKAKKYPDTNKISAEHKDDQSSTQDNVQLKTMYVKTAAPPPCG